MTSIDSVTSRSTLMAATSELTSANYWDHFKARLGISRNDHTVQPGLYRLGSPTADSPVFVTANYSLSFDALRTVLNGMDAFLLVLDTKGINVWCAAGKKTFGTRELINRIQLVDLKEVVNHRRLKPI
jgi:CO dehydrogenase/acetyl-CoA synthase gamma subunit (corrinoid Fe-S protein)